MLNVIYEDKDKIIVNKPAGQLSQSARGFDMDLVSEVLTYRKIRVRKPMRQLLTGLTDQYQVLCL